MSIKPDLVCDKCGHEPIPPFGEGDPCEDMMCLSEGHYRRTMKTEESASLDDRLLLAAKHFRHLADNGLPGRSEDYREHDATIAEAERLKESRDVAVHRPDAGRHVGPRGDDAQA